MNYEAMWNLLKENVKQQMEKPCPSAATESRSIEDITTKRNMLNILEIMNSIETNEKNKIDIAERNKIDPYAL